MKPEKILIVAQNWIGDALFSTPAIRAIRKKYPNAQITILAPKRAEAVFVRNPHVNQTIVYNERASFFSPALWKTVAQLRRERFNKAIFFHRSKTKVWMAYLAGIAERWGYSIPGRKTMLTRSVMPPMGGRIHRIDYFLFLLEGLGIGTDARTMDFVPSDSADSELDKIFIGQAVRRDAPYVVVHIAGNWAMKRWLLEYFAQWIYYVQEQYGYTVIICGDGSEAGAADKVLKRFKGKSVYSFCGKTSLDATALLLAGAKLFLSNDSGPIHLAATQKTKILGLYGPTSPEETGPVSEGPVKIMRLDVGCEVPCYFRHCNYRVCMDWLLPAQVFDKTVEMLSQHEA